MIPEGWERLWDYPLTEASLVVDVGGHRGNWTEELLKKVQCEVVIFEPIREFYDFLVLKFADNHRVAVVNAGLSSRTKKVQMSKAEERSSEFDGVVAETVQMFPSSTLLRDFCTLGQRYLPQVDLVTINAEGAEYEIIESLVADGLMNRIRFLQVEFHPFIDDWLTRRERCRRLLGRTHEPKFFTPERWEAWERK